MMVVDEAGNEMIEVRWYKLSGEKIRFLNWNFNALFCVFKYD